MNDTYDDSFSLHSMSEFLDSIDPTLPMPSPEKIDQLLFVLQVRTLQVHPFQRLN